MGAQSAPAPAPAKTLGDRITYAPHLQTRTLVNYLIQHSKAKAAAPKPKAAKGVPAPKPVVAGKKAVAGGRQPRRGRNGGRPKPKTADELDAEMADYFASNDGNVDSNGGAVQPVGDGAMDEIM
jgi:THO complex subunit 4